MSDASKMIKLSKFASDMTGWRIGKLVAEHPVGRTQNGNVIWFCSCDCGGSVERVGSTLRSSDWGLQHCGCERIRPPSARTAASEREKAYFAGYTDAEGCISIVSFKRRRKSGPYTYWAAFVSFGQTQPMVVERMHAVYGGGLTVRKRGHRRRQKEWRVQALAEVRRFLSDVIPYLREKRAQADIVLTQFSNRSDHAINLALSESLVRFKAARLGAIAIEPRLSHSRQVGLKCRDCDANALSRGYCAKHYQKAKRESRIVSNATEPFVYCRTPREFDAPYFAGYFDGDGCVAISHVGGRWYPRVSFTQTQPDALMELHAVYGGSLTVEKANDATRRDKLSYQLVRRQAVFAFLRDIGPFVVEKLDQVELLVAQYHSDMSFDEGRQLKRQLSEMKQREMSEGS